MAQLYPLLLLPDFRERLWGSRDLSLLYPHKVARKGGQFEQPIGEVWLTGEDCRVANGEFAGQTLADVTKRFGAELTGGSVAADPHRFPLLLKFLFPQEKLSVQVHPDDEQAQRTGEPCGKTECWYVVAAAPGAQVALGLKPGVDRGAVKAAIEQRRLEELMNWVEIRPGELIYVDAGTIHAIGPGSVLLETQQNSDTTYRLYDYGRPRQLHIDQGLAVMKERTRAGKVTRAGNNGAATLVSSPCFKVDKFVVRETREIKAAAQASSAQVLVALDGCGVIEADGVRSVTFAKGECVVLPASMGEYRLRPQWALECVRATLPTEKVPEPVTSL